MYTYTVAKQQCSMWVQEIRLPVYEGKPAVEQRQGVLPDWGQTYILAVLLGGI